MINNSRLTPFNLAKMFSLKGKDPDTWQMFHLSNFSINKTSIPFSAIRVDHAIEQEKRAVKLLEGIKDIKNNQRVLNEYFLSAFEIFDMLILCDDSCIDRFSYLH